MQWSGSWDTLPNWQQDYGRSTGSGRSKYLILNGLHAYFGFKKGLFGAKKGDIGGEAESYNALFDAKKCDIGPENACFWVCFAYFSIC